ncbi:MAG: NPCBM/NEW2 domain-containing protein [Bacteroidetes bacterium]|nr:NPCBM/NEW2 domain-containing protein [Bacteroidota bacterium]
MFKIFTIGISLVWFSIVIGQSFGDNFKLAYPDLVHQGKSFEVSIITSNEFKNADELDLYIIPKSGIKPDAFYLQIDNQVMEIEYTSASTEGYLYDAVMFSIDLTQSAFENGSSFFQILMRFKSEFVDYSEIEFYGEFRKNDRLVDYLNSTSKQLMSDYPNHYRIKINFYKSGIREKALLLLPNSEFSIRTDLNIQNNMLFEYWINLTQNGEPFLEIKNNSTSLVEYSLVTNEYQILTCESDFNNELSITPHFIPDNVWNHISILFSFAESKTEDSPPAEEDVPAVAYERAPTWAETVRVNRSALFEYKNSFIFSANDVTPDANAIPIDVEISDRQTLWLVANRRGQAVWCSPQLVREDGTTLSLTTLEPFSQEVGRGELKVDTAVVAGQNFPESLLAPAASKIGYLLDGKYKRFKAGVGLNESSRNGRVDFYVCTAPVFEMLTT